MYTLRYKLPHVRDLFMNYFRLIIALFSFIYIGNTLFSMGGPQTLAMERSKQTKQKIQACCIASGVVGGAVAATQTSYLWLLPFCIASGIAGAAYVEKVHEASQAPRNLQKEQRKKRLARIRGNSQGNKRKSVNRYQKTK